MAIIRLSGPEAVHIASLVFKPSQRKSSWMPKSHRIYHGHVLDSDGAMVDEVRPCCSLLLQACRRCDSCTCCNKLCRPVILEVPSHAFQLVQDKLSSCLFFFLSPIPNAKACLADVRLDVMTGCIPGISMATRGDTLYVYARCSRDCRLCQAQFILGANNTKC